MPENVEGLGAAVLRRAVVDATTRAASIPMKYRYQARRFLLGEEGPETMLDFWCEVAGIPRESVVTAARHLAANRWREKKRG